MWCILKVDAEYVARMEDVLDLYAEQLDPKRPVVCFDESPPSSSAKRAADLGRAPGRLERFDYEYRRKSSSISSSSWTPTALAQGQGHGSSHR